MTTPSIDRCPVCQYDLTGLPAIHRCPECGFAYDEDTRIWHPEVRPAWMAFLAILGLATILVSLFVIGVLPRGYLWPQVSVGVGAGCTGAAAAMFSIKARKRRLFAVIAPGGVMARTSGGSLRVQWEDVWADTAAPGAPSPRYRRLLAAVKLEVLLSRREQAAFEVHVREAWVRYRSADDPAT